MLRIIINGACGKMGRELAQTISRTNDCIAVAGIDIFPSQPMPGFRIFKSLRECDIKADVLIDFTHADALGEVLKYAVDKRIALVLATTGYSHDDIEKIVAASHIIPIFNSANMSLGVNVVRELSQAAAAALGHSYDIEIVETHHNTKLDSPSGTARMLADAINDTLDNSMRYSYGRHGLQELRDKREIGLHAVRGGTVTGDHRVGFYGVDETIIIEHRAASRAIFAQGAIAAAKYVYDRLPQLYDMQSLIAYNQNIYRLDVSRGDIMFTLRKMPFKPSLAATLFTALADVNIDMISQTAPVDGMVDISFTAPAASKSTVVSAARGLPCDIDIYEDIAKLTLSGSAMADEAGIAARMFGLLGEEGALVYIVTTSETKISVCISSQRLDAAVNGIKNAFHININ